MPWASRGHAGGKAAGGDFPREELEFWCLLLTEDICGAYYTYEADSVS
jgi:hypothetical protein